MQRRDFVKVSAVGLLAIAIPWAFPKPATIESTLESLGFKRGHDLLKVKIGSFKGSDLKRSFDVNKNYYHDKGTLRLMKYPEGRGAHRYGKEYTWVVEWNPYKADPPYKYGSWEICAGNEADVIKAIYKDRAAWRI